MVKSAASSDPDLETGLGLICVQVSSFFAFLLGILQVSQQDRPEILTAQRGEEMTPEQVDRLGELPRLIANERDEEKVKLLAAELLRLTTLEFELQSRIPPEAMPSWLCPACGISLREHTSEMIRRCTRMVWEESSHRHN